MSLVLALAVAAAHPQPIEPSTFGDWYVGCDNGWGCKAVSLSTGSQGKTLLDLAIEREGTPGAVATLRVAVPEDGHPGDPQLFLDDRPLMAARGDPVTLDRRLIAALLRGRAVERRDINATDPSRASLVGLAAALRYMDARQRRTGTTSALVSPGRRVATAVPPALPVIMSQSPGSRPPPTVNDALARRLLRRYDISCANPDEPVASAAHRLDATHSLLLIAIPCVGGAYNGATSAWLLDNAGRATPVPIDGGSPTIHAGGWLVNATWDASTRRLVTRSLMRGGGDCGTGRTHAWDGARLRLVHEEAMPECLGAGEWIVTWRARVVQR